jgi:hypothetical protein
VRYQFAGIDKLNNGAIKAAPIEMACDQQLMITERDVIDVGALPSGRMPRRTSDRLENEAQPTWSAKACSIGLPYWFKRAGISGDSAPLSRLLLQGLATALGCRYGGL